MRTTYGPIFTLRPYERGIQETFGKYNRFVMPGLGFQVPLIHVLRVRDIREHTMDIHPQPVITKDNVEIQVDGIMWVRPTPMRQWTKVTTKIKRKSASASSRFQRGDNVQAIVQ